MFGMALMCGPHVVVSNSNAGALTEQLAAASRNDALDAPCFKYSAAVLWLPRWYEMRSEVKEREMLVSV